MDLEGQEGGRYTEMWLGTQQGKQNTWKIVNGKHKTQPRKSKGKTKVDLDRDVFPVTEMLECNIHPEEAEVKKPWAQPLESSHSGKEE